MVTSQPGHGIVRQLETGLKDGDLVSLKRLLVVQIHCAGDWIHDAPSPEATPSETEGRKHRYAYDKKSKTHTHTVAQIETAGSL